MKKRKKKIGLFLLILSPFLLAAAYVLLLNDRPGTLTALPEHQKNEIRVGTLNANWLSFNSDASLTAKHLLSSAQAHKLDILLLQEYKSHWQLDEKAFTALFRKEFKYISIEDECVCLSKFPILSHKRIKYEDFSDNFSDLILQLPNGKKLRILEVHLMTTGINNFTDPNAPHAISGVGVGYTFFGNSAIRKNQSLSLVNYAENISSPLIIAGDFNCVPFSTPYRKMLLMNLKDSFFEMGKGKGSTYRGLKDLFRIDYIFYNEKLFCTDCRIVDDGISDHKMLVSTFTLNEESTLL